MVDDKELRWKQNKQRLVMYSYGGTLHKLVGLSVAFRLTKLVQQD